MDTSSVPVTRQGNNKNSSIAVDLGLNGASERFPNKKQLKKVQTQFVSEADMAVMMTNKGLEEIKQKKLNELMKGAGAGMSKAFKQIGGKSFETEDFLAGEAVITKSLQLKISTLKAQFSRSEQRQRFRDKMNQSRKVQLKMAEIA